jgi:hypothetical protein
MGKMPTYLATRRRVLTMTSPAVPRCCWITLALALFSASELRAQEAVSFRNDVMAVLSRAGCNQGTCHGNLYGKGGFKLSLRGQDPDFDFDVLTRGTLARRLNPQQPEASLVLLKATGSVPHEGGQRFPANSFEYKLLLQWIAEGLCADLPSTPKLKRLEVTPVEKFLVQPENETKIIVKAHFSSGDVRDVTNLAVFESSHLTIGVEGNGIVRSTTPGQATVLVRYLDKQVLVRLAFVAERPDFVWANPKPFNFVDDKIFARLKKLRLNPSDVCPDTVFLRRVYLDLLGVLPTPDETVRFLADKRADKRARLVDELLERPEFADFWAQHWSDVLRSEEKQLDKKGVQAFYDWIRKCVADNLPLNEFARQLVASRGGTYSMPAANYYRALREPQIRAEATAQVFLGIRMQCAKCHNHPFDQWTQNDYHRLTAFFARVQYDILENKRKDKLDKHEFDGEQVVWIARRGEYLHPVTKVALQPRFLGADAPEFFGASDRLPVLADWIADPKNPFFARTQVNRVWYHLFGRGIVDPNDDFRISNPPANPELLDALSKDFVAHKFDLKHLIRTIMNSRTYQASAQPNETNRDDEVNFSHASVRSLQAEQLLDAIAQASGVPQMYEGFPLGTRAGQLPGAMVPGRGKKTALLDTDKFLRMFGKPERLLSCDCERSEDTTLNQALQMITGQLVNKSVSAADNRIGKLLAAGKSNGDILEDLYLATLCRLPNQREREVLLARIERALDRRLALEDILWALLNSKEFLLRQ